MRIIFRVLTIVLLLVLAAGIYIEYGVSVEAIKKRAEKEVARATGRKLEIAGDVERHLSLVPAIVAHDVSLANPSWAKTPKLMTAASLTIKVQLMPLLEGKVRLAALQLDGAEFNLERATKGQGSWELAPAAPAADKNSAGVQGAAATNPVAKKTSGFSIDWLGVHDGKITYYDHRSRKSRTLQISDLAMHHLTQNGMESFDLKGGYRGYDLALAGSLSNTDLLMISGVLQGKALNAQVEGSLSLKDNTFDATLQAKAEQMKQLLALLEVKSDQKMPVTLQGNIGGTPDIIRLKGFKVSVADATATSDLSVDISKQVPVLSGKVELDKMTLPQTPEAKSEAAVHVSEATKTSEAKEQEATPLHTDQRTDQNTPIDYSWLDAAQGDVRLNIGELRYGDLMLTAVQSRVQMDPHKLTYKLDQAQVAGGTLKGQATLSDVGGQPQYTFSAWTDDVVLGQIWSAFGDDAVVTDGKTKAAINLSGTATTTQTMRRTAKGYVRFFVDSLLYKVPDSVAEVKSFVQALRGRQDEKRTVKVKCGIGRFDVEGGIAKTKALAIKTSGAVAKGTGQLSLGDSTVDMMIQAHSGSVGVVDVVPPLRVKGPLEDPSVYPDSAGTLLNIGKLVLGATSGVGLVAVLGEKAADRLGITEDNDPCLTELTQTAEEQHVAPSPDKTMSATPPAKPSTVKDMQRAIKSDVKEMKDGAKKLLGL